MSATLESIIAAATAEWEHWGKSVWNVAANTSRIGHRDDESKYAQYVIDKYCSIVGVSPSLVDIQDDRYYWSAVGMSAIMKSAGFSKQEFPFSQSHSKFIRHFIAARNSNDQSVHFHGYRLGEAGGAPDLGDIVAYARGKSMTQSKALALFDSTSNYESHTDVVVAKSGREIQVIGCNVLDSVTKKTLQLDAAGHIKDDQHFWFAVLKSQNF
jgi:hypothetical protein